MNKKPPAPCLTGGPPGRIQQQQVYSTNMNGIVPEKTVSWTAQEEPLEPTTCGKGLVTVHSIAYT